MTVQKEHLQGLLELARNEVRQLEAALANYDPYPVGTILRRGTTYAIKLRTVHLDAASRSRPVSNVPVWTTMHSDFSGRTFPTLTELKSQHGFITEWVEVFVP